MKIVAVLLLAAGIAACAPNVEVLRENDADDHARRNVAAGDCRLMGVYGVTLDTPGAPFETAQRLGVRGIEGTSDTWGSYEGMNFTLLAQRYAAAYNREILVRCRA